ncbi:MAG: glucose-6-phosphate dehydrogenase assembly protein OpcA, partial [Propionibacteriaceae bacterium]|nr:glucose-6-phosphate dehydrogenase assembly protein OpcA [Propionibacteriaceae bacterium]
VTWWPDRLPDQPASTPLGTLAVHRVTNVLKAPGSLDERLAQLQRGYTAGDTDLAWTRITWWRAHLAAVVEHSPYEPVTHAVIHTYADNPSAHLLAAWLGTRLNCTIQLVYQRDSTGMTRVELHRQTGMVAINRPEGSDVATLTMPGTPDQRFRLSHRTLAECLSEELRRPGEDTVYGQVIEQGLPWLSQADHVSDAHAD